MRRREFITLIGGAAAWPLAARAQQADRIRRIGVLYGGASIDVQAQSGLIGGAAAWSLVAQAQEPATPVIGFLGAVSPDGFTERVRAFRQGLKEAGFIEGENVGIEYRWAENQLDRLSALAADLVRKRVTVIFAHGGTAPAIAAKAATTTIPIVFAIPEDPVSLGLIASLSRPGANLTGVNFFFGELVPKRLELLRELVPAMTRVAVFVNPANHARAEFLVREAASAGRTMGLRIQVFNTGTIREINAAVTTLASQRPDALLVTPDPFFITRRVPATFFSMAAANCHAGSAPWGSNVVSGARLCRSGRTDELRAQHQRCLPSSWRLYWPRPQGREGRGFAGRAIEQVRARHQCANGTLARPRRSTDAARARRRGDRMKAAGMLLGDFSNHARGRQIRSAAA